MAESALPEPFTVVLSDFRPSAKPPAKDTLRLVTWNIERGYKLPAIVDELRSLDADVIALQEVDIGCERSGFADCSRSVASALGLSCAFVAEFVELHSPLRTAATQGGGVHGQALLSRYALRDCRALKHSHQPVDWAAEGEARREPRRGGRVVLCATVECPFGPLLVYNLHLEVFCGLSDRLRQLCDVLADCRLAGRPPKQAVLGDLNTMAHSVARLSPSYCCDSFRWRSWGSTEARFWADNVFAVYEGSEAAAAALRRATAAATGGRYPPPKPLLLAPGEQCNPRLRAWGLSEDVCKLAINPGFVDPFCPDEDVTLDNPKYYGLMRGRLDWMLLRGLACKAHALGNRDFGFSDHAWMSADVHEPCQGA
jgi:endonuclease/exonuclease/phosphatase family metal-dependent hydrolase